MNSQGIDFTIETNNLYREESITDLNVGAIRCLVPIKPDNTEDKDRELIFYGHTQLMSPQGMVPLRAKLEATTLDKAIEAFPKAMEKAMEEMIENAKKMQAEQEMGKGQNDSNIIIPGR